MSSREERLLDHFAEDVSDRDMRLLDMPGDLTRDPDDHLGHTGDASAGLSRERDRS